MDDFFIRLVAPGIGGNETRGDPLTQSTAMIDGTITPSDSINFTELPNPVGSWGAFWANLSMNQSLPKLQNTDTVTVTIEYNVTSEFFWWPDADVSSGDLDDMPEWANITYMGDMLWNRSSPGQVGYEPNNPEIQNLANSIVGAETNVYSILRAIFLWNYENINYEVGHPDLRSVDETLANMSGDCDDQSLLFVSLARAAGVPAWMQMGMLYNNANNTWENHVWVQTYIPGVGNVSIDPSNDLFLINRPDRITTYTDQGIAEDMEMFYFYIGVAGPATVTDVLTPEYYWASSTQIQVPFSHMR